MATTSSNSYKELIKKFRVLSDDETIATTAGSEELAEYLADEIYANHDAWVASQIGVQGFTEDLNLHEDIECEIVPTSSGCAVHVMGEEVIYDEFGTGQQGEENPHPLKSAYGLQPYNSGPRIIHDWYGTGQDIWFHNRHIHNGTPAGMFIFQSVVEMNDGFAKELVEEMCEKAINKAGFN